MDPVTTTTTLAMGMGDPMANAGPLTVDTAWDHLRVEDGPPTTTAVLTAAGRCGRRPDQPGGHEHRRGHCCAPQDRLHRQPLSRRAHDGPTRVETRQRG